MFRASGLSLLIYSYCVLIISNLESTSGDSRYGMVVDAIGEDGEFCSQKINTKIFQKEDYDSRKFE